MHLVWAKPLTKETQNMLKNTHKTTGKEQIQNIYYFFYLLPSPPQLQVTKKAAQRSKALDDAIEQGALFCNMLAALKEL